MKVGILGGTFNPIHYGHLRIAEDVRDRFALDRVLFVPAATPPHKPLAGNLSFAQRASLVERAIAGNPAFALSDIEGRRGGTSWLIDTLREFRVANPGDEFFFIMGSDSFADIGSWKEYRDYFSLCNIVVAERPGTSLAGLFGQLPADVLGEFVPYPAEKRLAHRSGYSVYFFAGVHHAVSSSKVRELLQTGRSIRYLVPPAVEHHLIEQEFYATHST